MLTAFVSAALIAGILYAAHRGWSGLVIFFAILLVLVI